MGLERGHMFALARIRPVLSRRILSFQILKNGVRLLTERQRTPDWFLLRKFRITGSVVCRIFRHIANATPDPSIARDPVTDPDVEASAMLLSLRMSRQQPPERPASISSTELQSKSLEELKALCNERGLPVSGTKTILKDRLQNYGRKGNSTERISLSGEILAAWFMKSASSTVMKIGTHNETKIAAHVKSFLLAHASIQVEAMKSYGLLCS